MLPNILGKEKQIKPVQLQLNAFGENKIIKTFPYETEVSPDQKIEINKTGTGNIFFTAYQTFQNPQPEKVEKDFIVNTNFIGKNATNKVLKAGEKMTLRVDIFVRNDAEYVMIEVPIPAGCSYDS